jgi:hypothetical protein
MKTRTRSPRLQKLMQLESPFQRPFSSLNAELSMLEELEKRVPQSIVQMQEKQISEWKKQANHLSQKDADSIDRVVKTIGDLLSELRKAKHTTKKRRVSVSRRAAKLFVNLAKAVAYPSRFNDFIRNMSLVYLISAFDNFLEEMMEVAFREQPKALVPFETTVTAEDLVKCRDLDVAKAHLARKAIAAMMYGDIEEINKRLKQRFKIALSSFDGWERFKERFYRRNLIIHRSGEIDDVYRRKVGFKGKTKALRVSHTYLLQSLDLFRNIAVDLFDAFHSKFIGV